MVFDHRIAFDSQDKEVLVRGIRLQGYHFTVIQHLNLLARRDITQQ